jgi:hypothetical protein
MTYSNLDVCIPMQLASPKNVSGTVKRAIDAPLSHGTSNVLLNRLIDRLGIDAISRTMLLGHFKLGRIDVDCDDLRGTSILSSSNDSKALSERYKDAM